MLTSIVVAVATFVLIMAALSGIFAAEGESLGIVRRAKR